VLSFPGMSTGVFGFTEAKEMCQREMRSFLTREIAPSANSRAKLGYLPQEIWGKWCQFGVARLNLPEEGGSHHD